MKYILISSCGQKLVYFVCTDNWKANSTSYLSISLCKIPIVPTKIKFSCGGCYVQVGCLCLCFLCVCIYMWARTWQVGAGRGRGGKSIGPLSSWAVFRWDLVSQHLKLVGLRDITLNGVLIDNCLLSDLSQSIYLYIKLAHPTINYASQESPETYDLMLFIKFQCNFSVCVSWDFKSF